VSAFLVSAGVAGNQFASYLLNVLAARLLVPAAFGELGSLLAVLVIGAVPAMGVQTVTALRVARRDSVGELVALGLVTAAGVTAVGLAVSPLLVVFLHLGSVVPAIFLAFALAGITFLGVCLGMLQGEHRFTAVAGLLTADAVVRIGGTLTGLAITRTATGALAGAVIGAAAVAVTGWFVCGRPRPRRHGKAHVSDVLHYSRIASNDRWSTLLIWGAVAVEIVLVTVWLNGALTQVVTAAVIATGTLVCAGALVELRSRREPVDTSGDDGRHGE
jgi:hypothetical protein